MWGRSGHNLLEPLEPPLESLKLTHGSNLVRWDQFLPAADPAAGHASGHRPTSDIGAVPILDLV
jgi:hypothetical protein